MSYFKFSNSRVIYLLYISFVLVCTSCANDDEVTPAALNSFKGEIAGTNFEATILSAVESIDFFTVIGNINIDANFQLYTYGNNLADHPITVSGPLVESVNIINELADSIFAQATSPNFDVDSALIELTDYFEEKIDSVFSDTTETILQENESYLFYLIDDVIYFSTAGTVTFTKIDDDLNRISGYYDIELRNLSNGFKNMVGTFEDIEYISQE